MCWPLLRPLRLRETRPHARGAHGTYGGTHAHPHHDEPAVDQQQAGRRACERRGGRAAAVPANEADALAEGSRVGQQDDRHRTAGPLPRLGLGLGLRLGLGLGLGLG